MYQAHWQLAAKPFEPFPDPKFYYPSEAHHGALLKLRYVVEQRQQAAALAGAAGLGKSLLIAQLRRQMPEAIAPVVVMGFPLLSPADTLASLADDLSGAQGGRYSVEESWSRIRAALVAGRARQQQALVVFEDAHLWEDVRMWETFRLLTNVSIDDSPAWTLLLVGQTRLLAQLEQWPQLEERMSMKCLLRPLTQEETASYVAHRLQAAGAGRTVFETQAVDRLHELSQGSPRRINRLADLALLVGYAEQRPIITVDDLDSVARELTAVGPE